MARCKQCTKFFLFLDSSGICTKCKLMIENAPQIYSESCATDVASPRASNRKALMLVPDPCAPFVMIAKANGYNSNKNMLYLEADEVCCAQYPTGAVRITAANGRSIVAKNNLPYLQQLQKYGSGSQNAIYALPDLFNTLGVSAGDTVYIEAC